MRLKLCKYIDILRTLRVSLLDALQCDLENHWSRKQEDCYRYLGVVAGADDLNQGFLVSSQTKKALES